MKEQELLLKELALMLERQDMLSKLTEGKCLDEYGYSETMMKIIVTLFLINKVL